MAQQFSERKNNDKRDFVTFWHISFSPLLHFGQVLTRLLPVYVALYRIDMVVAKTILGSQWQN